MFDSDKGISQTLNWYPEHRTITILTIVAIVLTVFEQTISVNLLGLLIIVEVAAQMQYGGNSRKGKELKGSPLTSDKGISAKLSSNKH